jgi:hypothetical protein
MPDKIQRPGISEAILISAGVKASDYPEAASIEIPYWTAEGEMTRYKRWRLPSVRPNGQKYHQEVGSGVYAYFPPGFYHRNGSENPYGLAPSSVVLVEGEFKALSLLELGIYAIGLPSFTVYSRDENEHRRLLRDLQVTLSKERIETIYFLGDADTATNFEFSRNAVFLASAAFPAQVLLPRIPMDRPKGIDDCKEALGPEFSEFFSGLIKTAITLPRKANEAEVALLLFERELDAVKNLAGMERERQFTRIVQLCAGASRFAKSHATSRLCDLARKVLGIGKTELKQAIEAQRKEQPKTESKANNHEAGQSGPKQDSRPIIMHPQNDRYISDFARELGGILKSRGFFQFHGNAAQVRSVTVKARNGKEYQVKRLVDLPVPLFSTVIETYCSPVFRTKNNTLTRKSARSSARAIGKFFGMIFFPSRAQKVSKVSKVSAAFVICRTCNDPPGSGRLEAARQHPRRAGRRTHL